MQTGGKKFIKPQKTKFRKNIDERDEFNTKPKRKHHDKSVYRLLRNEEKNYAL